LAEDTVLDPIAAAEAVLGEDERELGAILVDIGGGKTSVAIYHHGAVRHTVVLPIGGEHFSKRHCGRIANHDSGGGETQAGARLRHFVHG
jgi:Ethanolamine utilization protein EutJ (predicted chaperonin)